MKCPHCGKAVAVPSESNSPDEIVAEEDDFLAALEEGVQEESKPNRASRKTPGKARTQDVAESTPGVARKSAKPAKNTKATDRRQLGPIFGPIVCLLIGSVVTTAIAVPLTLIVGNGRGTFDAWMLYLFAPWYFFGVGLIFGRFFRGGSHFDDVAEGRTASLAASHGLAGWLIELAMTLGGIVLVSLPQLYVWAFRPVFGWFGLDVQGDLFNLCGYRYEPGRGKGDKPRVGTVAICASCRKEVPAKATLTDFFIECTHCGASFKVDEVRPGKQAVKKEKARAESEVMLAAIVPNVVLWGSVILTLIHAAGYSILPSIQWASTPPDVAHGPIRAEAPKKAEPPPVPPPPPLTVASIGRLINDPLGRPYALYVKDGTSGKDLVALKRDLVGLRYLIFLEGRAIEADADHLSVISQLSELRGLDMGWCHLDETGLLSAIEPLAKLDTLQPGRQIGSAGPPAAFIKRLAEMPALKHIHLEQSGIGKMLAQIAESPSIETISCILPPDFYEYDYQQMKQKDSPVRLLTRCRNLSLDGVGIRDDELVLLTQLERLNSRGGLSDEVVRRLSAFPNLRTIEGLSLGSGPDFPALFLQFPQLEFVENPRMSESQLLALRRSDSLIAFRSYFSAERSPDFKLVKQFETGGHSGIQNFHADYSGDKHTVFAIVTDEFPVNNAQLTTWTSQLKDLRVLSFEQPISRLGFPQHVFDKDIPYIARTTSLQRLNLDDCVISDKSIDDLALLQNLKSLSLRRTLVTQAGVERLRAKLPACRIVFENDPAAAAAGVAP